MGLKPPALASSDITHSGKGIRKGMFHASRPRNIQTSRPPNIRSSRHQGPKRPRLQNATTLKYPGIERPTKTLRHRIIQSPGHPDIEESSSRRRGIQDTATSENQSIQAPGRRGKKTSRNQDLQTLRAQDTIGDNLKILPLSPP